MQTLVHFGNAWLWPHQNVLDVNLEEGPFTWASTVATFAGAFVAVLAALARPERAWRWWTLAGLLAFLSLDDAALLHERVGARRTTSSTRSKARSKRRSSSPPGS